MNNMNRSRIIVGIGFVLTIMAIVFVVIFKTSYSYSSDANYLGEYDSIASDDEIEIMESDVASDGESGEVEEEEEVNISTDGWDLTKVHIEYDSKGVPVPVPIGYVASGASDEKTVDTGFVIYEGEDEVNDENSWDESTKRNQWVWVPVSDPERIYEEDASGKKTGKRYDFSSSGRKLRSNKAEPGLSSYDNEKYFARYNLIGMTREKFYEEIQNEFNSTIDSIKKYGGFYIGRYETGNLSSIPVVQRMNMKTNTYDTWYTMYSKIKYLGANSNIVKANMIWGCLWDETLQWLVDSGSKKYSDIATHDGSKTWGNYIDSTFSYKSTSGDSIKKENVNTRIPTGSTEYTKENNIYDLAGNVSEWTLEGSRYCRGGSYLGTSTYVSYCYQSVPISNRYVEDAFTVTGGIGFRAYLYIK